MFDGNTSSVSRIVNLSGRDYLTVKRAIDAPKGKVIFINPLGAESHGLALGYL
jgi:hypothetical protein